MRNGFHVRQPAQANMNALSRRLIRLILTLACLLACGSSSAQAPVSWPYEFLRKYAHLSPAEFHDMEQGRVVVKILPTRVKQEVVSFGAVRIDVPQEFFVAQFRDIEKFKKGRFVPEVKKFSDPPSPEDLKGLSLELGEIESLKRCRVHDCPVKLPAESMESFQRQIDWKAPDYREKAVELLQQILLRRAQAYLASGSGTLGRYDDKKYSLDLAAEFRGLLDQSPYLAEYVPEFDHYLHEYPGVRLEGAEHFMYWSKEKYTQDAKAVTAITSTSIYRQEDTPGKPFLITSQQIYASHYFEGSLGVALLVDASEDPTTPRIYLVNLNRSRIDFLRGFFAFLIRGTIARRLQSEMKNVMGSLKKKMEASYLEESSHVEPRAALP
jgi:hypothetical protein